MCPTIRKYVAYSTARLSLYNKYAVDHTYTTHDIGWNIPTRYDRVATQEDMVINSGERLIWLAPHWHV